MFSLRMAELSRNGIGLIEENITQQKEYIYSPLFIFNNFSISQRDFITYNNYIV